MLEKAELGKTIPKKTPKIMKKRQRKAKGMKITVGPIEAATEAVVTANTRDHREVVVIKPTQVIKVTKGRHKMTAHNTAIGRQTATEASQAKVEVVRNIGTGAPIETPQHPTGTPGVKAQDTVAQTEIGGTRTIEGAEAPIEGSMSWTRNTVTKHAKSSPQRITSTMKTPRQQGISQQGNEKSHSK